MPELNRVPIDQFKSSEKLPIVVVLDNIRSQNNIGSVFRTSDAFLVQEIILCGITATPPHREIHKTALGATESVAWRYFESTRDAIHELRKNGFQIVGVEQTTHSKLLNDCKISAHQPIALIFGNEVQGLSDSILGDLDYSLEIPQSGTKHSLNVSVAAGIVLWHFYHHLYINLAM